MIRVSDVADVLRELAPLELAEEWDNVGLLVGDGAREVTSVMTCLTLSEDVVAEAVRRGAGMVVAHHPVLFRPVSRLTVDAPEGRALLTLIEAGVSVYSPHTAFDSAGSGINARLADALGLREVRPLRPAGGSDLQADEDPVATVGGGRYGRLEAAVPLAEFLSTVKDALGIRKLQYVGEDERIVETVAVACGSAAEFIADAARLGCDALVTGEARFHACLEARSVGLALILAGHYATERPAVEQLAADLAARIAELSVWASEVESDPVRWSIR